MNETIKSHHSKLVKYLMQFDSYKTKDSEKQTNDNENSANDNENSTNDWTINQCVKSRDFARMFDRLNDTEEFLSEKEKENLVKDVKLFGYEYAFALHLNKFIKIMIDPIKGTLNDEFINAIESERYQAMLEALPKKEQTRDELIDSEKNLARVLVVSFTTGINSAAFVKKYPELQPSLGMFNKTCLNDMFNHKITPLYDIRNKYKINPDMVAEFKSFIENIEDLLPRLETEYKNQNEDVKGLYLLCLMQNLAAPNQNDVSSETSKEAQDILNKYKIAHLDNDELKEAEVFLKLEALQLERKLLALACLTLVLLGLVGALVVTHGVTAPIILPFIKMQIDAILVTVGLLTLGSSIVTFNTYNDYKQKYHHHPDSKEYIAPEPKPK